MEQVELKNIEFLEYLKAELFQRGRRNKNYSLRSFAKSLDISPSSLSAIINGKRPLTNKMVRRLCEQLKVSPQRFISSSDERYSKVDLDSFSLISDWYYFAILELIKLKDFNSSIESIAERIGLECSQVKIAIDRLVRLGLIGISENGEISDQSTGFTTNIGKEIEDRALREYQKQILEKSLTALEDVPIENRNHTSMTFAVSKEDLEEGKKIIKKFRRDLGIFFQRKGARAAVYDEVYQLSVSLFPLTQNLENNKE